MGIAMLRTYLPQLNTAINSERDYINFLINLSFVTLKCSDWSIYVESKGAKIATSTGGITQADLDTKENVLTQNSQSNKKSLTVTDKEVITITEPTLYFKDTNTRSGIININNGRMYLFSGVANSETWTQVNCQWPLHSQTASQLPKMV